MGPNSAQIGQIWAKCAETWDNFDPYTGVESANVGPNSTVLGPNLANLDSTQIGQRFEN